jgi:uncharacterized membrane protein YesL
MAGKKRRINYLNIVLTGIIWLICCIPIATILSSSMAAYNTVSGILKGEDDPVSEVFFHAFKRYTKRWLAVFIPDALLIVWLIYVIIVLRGHGSGTTASVMLQAVVYVISAIFLGINLSLIACGGRFGDSPLQLIKLSLFCAFSHPLRSLAAVVTAVLMAAAVYLCIPLIIIMPAALWYVQCLIWNGVLKYYSIDHEDEEEEDEEDETGEDIIEDNDEYTVIRLGKLIIRKRKRRGGVIPADDDEDYEGTSDTSDKRRDRVVPKSEVDNAE